MKPTTGFTLIELLVVSTILAVLAAGALVSYSTSVTKSRDGKRQSDMEQVRSALEMHRADNGSYVVGTGVISASLNTLKTSGYIDKIPTDPKMPGWSDFLYTSPAGATYTLCGRMENIPANQACSCSSPYNYCTKNP